MNPAFRGAHPWHQVRKLPLDSSTRIFAGNPSPDIPRLKASFITRPPPTSRSCRRSVGDWSEVSLSNIQATAQAL
jgi:hypothetical protein